MVHYENGDPGRDEKASSGEGRSAPHRVRLPGFLLKEEIGLGDLIKRTSYSIGVPHCEGCERRAEALDRWIRFIH
jgi:hypothetical protein